MKQVPSIARRNPFCPSPRFTLNHNQKKILFRRRNIPMVRIRLRRTGSRGQPSYRIVVADKESPRDGRFLEIVGFYNPRTEPGTLEIKEDRIYEWMNKGALPTESVAQLFKTSGTSERYERLKKGESAEVLLAEAEQAKAARVTNNKTRK
jgi:small subunit ribosomal protein S16